MTLEEYQEKLKKENAPPTAAFNVRTVDDSGFKGMVAKGKEKGDKKFTIGVQPKPKAATPAAPKKEEKEKKEEKKEKVQVDVGFRMVFSSPDSPCILSLISGEPSTSARKGEG